MSETLKKIPDAVIVAARYRCQNDKLFYCERCPMERESALCSTRAKLAANRILRAFRKRSAKGRK